jgi:murein DD-endopeptidase MepM/ murein hydrolase activator NlpD
VEQQKDKKGARKIIKKMRHKSRLVVLNDDTFEEQFSMVLSPLNVFSWGGIFLLVFTVLVTLLIAFTPLRELIPGYADVNTRKLATYTALRADSIEESGRLNEQYVANIKEILEGKEGLISDSVTAPDQIQKTDIEGLELDPSKNDSILRKTVEEAERFNINQVSSDNSQETLLKMLLFPPLKGVITSHFNPGIGHYGVDIVPTAENASVSAAYDGVVIQAAWTSDEGHVLYVQHKGNLVSVYKHNSVLLKKVGDNIKAGEAICIVGNSGELSTGPHLHFELWYKGTPVDPEHYVVF